MQFYQDDENILYIDCHNNLQKAVKLVNKFEWFKFEVFLVEPNLHPSPSILFLSHCNHFFIPGL